MSWDGGGPTCGEMTSPIPHEPRTPDVIIAFDRSGSMDIAFGSGTRYTTERDILKPLVVKYEDLIRWGYEEFPIKVTDPGKPACPAGMSCCGDKVSVPPAFKNAVAVNARIETARMGYDLATPTASGLKNVKDFYAGFTDGIKDRYVLLSTDGVPNCSGAGKVSGDACGDAVSEVSALLAMGVKTIVLAVSEEVAMAPCMEMLAAAGGAPRPGGPPSYYPSTTPDELKKALGDLVGGLAKPSCVIDLTKTPPDPKKVAVFADGVQVPWDPGHADGWDYDPPPNTIRVFGSWCTKVETFMVKELSVRFGCPPCGATVSCP